VSSTLAAAAPATPARAAPARGALRRHLPFLLLLAPALGLLLALLAAPAVYVVWLGFHESTFGQQPRFVGLANYARLLADEAFWRAFWNTIVVVNLVVYGELALGLAVAVLLRGWMPGRRLIVAAILAPYAITESSGIVMWRFMLEPETGPATTLMAALGLPALAWDQSPVAALGLAALVAIWQHMPFTFLILYAALLTIPRETIEAAAVDGASRRQTFWRIEIPMLMPAILVAVLFRYIFAIRLFSEVWLLTGGGPARLTEVLAIYLYRETFQYREFGTASAAGVFMLLLSLLIAMPYLHRMAREVRREG